MMVIKVHENDAHAAAGKDQICYKIAIDCISPAPLIGYGYIINVQLGK